MTPFVAVSNGVLFLFGGAFLAVVFTPLIVAGVGGGAVLGGTVVAVGRRLLPFVHRLSGT